jgi:uncharacterized protein YndB with AHSA1/START domain
MPGELTAKSTVVIRSEPAAVWAALADPEMLSKPFFIASFVAELDNSAVRS